MANMVPIKTIAQKLLIIRNNNPSDSLSITGSVINVAGFGIWETTTVSSGTKEHTYL